MKPGDLVRYRRTWYTGTKRQVGLILESDGEVGWDAFYFVMWEDGLEWEDCKDIEVINEGR